MQCAGLAFPAGYHTVLCEVIFFALNILLNRLKWRLQQDCILLSYHSPVSPQILIRIVSLFSTNLIIFIFLIRLLGNDFNVCVTK